MRAYEARRRGALATDFSLKADLELIAQEWLALAEEVEWRLNGITAHSSRSKPTTPLSNRRPLSNSNSRFSPRTRTRPTRPPRSKRPGSLRGAPRLTFQQVQKYGNGTNRIGASRLVQTSRTELSHDRNPSVPRAFCHLNFLDEKDFRRKEWVLWNPKAKTTISFT